MKIASWLSSNRYPAACGGELHWGIKIHDLDMRNPAHGLGLYPIEQKLKYIPTDAEIEEVNNKLTPARKVLFEFVAETGCRINEAVRFFNNPEIVGTQIVLWTRKSRTQH
ncbi:hypothetical protein [Candidatus Magnetomonas plexicatena]|uniref:hypothetical protein n=1 Tax=Candidatus Magnetomonas plexicatena TaxID=2552947 RepID=UPI001100E166|nr:hypothetical protein E2O03_012395 [Nitrospirales bacterium LBB_01]